jgi:hypothetical protein
VTYASTAVSTYTKWQDDSIIVTIPAHNPRGYGNIVVTNSDASAATILSGICYTTTNYYPGWAHGEGGFVAYPATAKYQGRLFCNYWSKPNHTTQTDDSTMLYESLDSGRTFPNKIFSLKSVTDSALDGSSYCIATIGGNAKHVLIITKFTSDMAHWYNICYYKNVLPNSQGGYDAWSGPVVMMTDSAGKWPGGQLGVMKSLKQLSNGTVVFAPYGGIETTGNTWDLYWYSTTNLTAWATKRIHTGSQNLDETSVEELKTGGSFTGKVRIFIRDENKDSLFRMTSTDYGATWGAVEACPGLKLDTGKTSMHACPPATIRANDNAVMMFWGQHWYRSTDETETWQDLGWIKQINTVAWNQNKLYGDICEIANGVFYMPYCSNGITFSYPYWLWRTPSINGSNNTTIWASGAKRGWQITLDSTKIPTTGRVTLAYDLSRITNDAWWSSMPSTKIMQIYDVRDNVYLPSIATQPINKVGKTGIVQWSAPVYGKKKIFVLQTGSAISANTNFGAFYTGDFLHVISMDDTDGVIRDNANNISEISDAAITQNQAGKLGKCISMNANAYLVLPPFYNAPDQNRFVVSMLYKESPLNYGATDAGAFRWYQGSGTYYQVYREKNGGKDSLYIENHYLSSAGQQNRIPYADYIDTSKYMHLMIFYDCKRATDTINNQFYINGVCAGNYKVSATKNTSGFPECYANPAFYYPSGGNSMVGKMDQFMFGNDYDTLQQAQMATAMYYNQMLPNNFWIEEKIVSPISQINSAKQTFKNSIYKLKTFLTKSFK